MTGSLIVGVVLVALGGLCVLEAMILATASALNKKAQVQAAFAVDPWTKLLEAIKDLIAEFGKLDVVGKFLVVGLVLIGGGSYLLSARPF